MPGYEYQPLRFPRGTDRETARHVLAVKAEFEDWELDRVRVYPDGTRRVLLRRPRSRSGGTGAQL